jgi:hypothetical protein
VEGPTRSAEWLHQLVEKIRIEALRGATREAISSSPAETLVCLAHRRGARPDLRLESGRSGRGRPLKPVELNDETCGMGFRVLRSSLLPSKRSSRYSTSWRLWASTPSTSVFRAPVPTFRNRCCGSRRDRRQGEDPSELRRALSGRHRAHRSDLERGRHSHRGGDLHRHEPHPPVRRGLGARSAPGLYRGRGTVHGQKRASEHVRDGGHDARPSRNHS